MSLIIFFGLALIITLLGGAYTVLVIRHHWGRKSQAPANSIEKN